MSNISMNFNKKVAKELGTDAAIILSNIEFWQSKNKANKKNLHDGKFWTYNSVSAWCELFDYLTESQIRRCLKKLEDANYLVTGNYNKSNYDRTKWYSSIRDVDLSISSNGTVQNNEPIPDIKPNINTDNSLSDEEIKENELFTEQVFLQRWRDARLKFTGFQTNFRKLKSFDLIKFNEIKKLFSKRDIERAIQGMYEQKEIYKYNQAHPSHFLDLDNFQVYLDCFHSKEQLFSNNKFKKTVERI